MLKKNSVQYSKVCIIDTVYSLFIYFLITSKADVDNTFFFFSDGINENMRMKFPNSCFISYKKFLQKNSLARIWFRLKMRIIAPLKWRFLSSAELYGHDHLFISPALVGKRKMIVIEDGIGNYDMFALRPVYSKGLFIRRLLFGPLVTEIPYGGSSYAKKVILTGLGPVLDILQKKSVVININHLWQTLPENDKQRILGYFSFQVTELKELSQKKIILFTQPFADDITEEKLIGIYTEMLKGIDRTKVVIKTHPRDDVDYKLAFPDIYVFNKPIPMELLTLLGVKFDEAYTISSGAVLTLPEPIKIHYVGNQVNKILLDKYGTLKLEELR